MTRPRLLAAREVESVRSVIEQLGREGRTVDHHGVIARLGFGFWTSLLSDRYEGSLWPAMARSAFRGMPRPLRSRAELSRRANEARKLRNRVSHHEPIWHWHDLVEQHVRLRQTIDWLSPAVGECVAVLDRFPAVRVPGWRQYTEQARELLG